MANLFEKITGQAGNVLDTIQDVLDVVKHTDGPTVATPTTVPATTTATATAPAPAPSSQDSILLVLVVVVLAVVLLR